MGLGAYVFLESIQNSNLDRMWGNATYFEFSVLNIYAVNKWHCEVCSGLKSCIRILMKLHYRTVEPCLLAFGVKHFLSMGWKLHKYFLVH